MADAFEDLLLRLLASLRLTGRQAHALAAHYELLVRWNRVLNLTRVTRPEDAVLRHYGESLFLNQLLPAEMHSVLDIGSGAGFPGIPIAVARPECLVTLCEAHQRKAVFLREATRALPNVVVVANRAETVDTAAFEWIVSRAVAPAEVVALARHGVALLVGEEDAAEVGAAGAICWDPAVLLPWGRRRVALLGRCQ